MACSMSMVRLNASHSCSALAMALVAQMLEVFVMPRHSRLRYKVMWAGTAGAALSLAGVAPPDMGGSRVGEAVLTGNGNEELPSQCLVDGVRCRK